MQGKISSIKRKVKKYQHLRCTFWIITIAILVLVISFVVKVEPLDSIFQNVFAGLITGVVVTLVGSLKTRALKDGETEKAFLLKINDLYKESCKAFWEYRKQWNTDDYEETTYELICEMEAVEAFISHKDNDERLIQVLEGKKPSELFQESNVYDFSKQQLRSRQMLDMFDSEMEYTEDFKRKIEQEIEATRRAHRALNRKVMNRLYELEERAIEIETSIP